MVSDSQMWGHAALGFGAGSAVWSVWCVFGQDAKTQLSYYMMILYFSVLSSVLLLLGNNQDTSHLSTVISTFVAHPSGVSIICLRKWLDLLQKQICKRVNLPLIWERDGKRDVKSHIQLEVHCNCSTVMWSSNCGYFGWHSVPEMIYSVVMAFPTPRPWRQRQKESVLHFA